jgi:hypothetical protein
MAEATATKPAGAMNRPINDGSPVPAGAPISPAPKPTWTTDDSIKLGELLDKRTAFLTAPRKRITVGELRSRIGAMPAEAEILYEDWSDGGGVYVTEVTVGAKTLVLL